MKKYCWLAVLLLMTLIVGSIGTAQAEVIAPLGQGQIGYQAVVLCEELTVREKASTSAKAVRTLKYGSLMIVTRQTNGWAEIAISDSVDAGPIGWVNSDYIVIDPAWFRTSTKTAVYAWNSTAAPKVALLNVGTTLPVLKIEGDWIVVSLRGAAGWIHK